MSTSLEKALFEYCKIFSFIQGGDQKAGVEFVWNPDQKRTEITINLRGEEYAATYITKGMLDNTWYINRLINNVYERWVEIYEGRR